MHYHVPWQLWSCIHGAFQNKTYYIKFNLTLINVSKSTNVQKQNVLHFILGFAFNIEKTGDVTELCLLNPLFFPSTLIYATYDTMARITRSFYPSFLNHTATQALDCNLSD